MKDKIRYTEIYFPNSRESLSNYIVKNDLADKPHLIPSLSLVNILIGANNSGKSRFIRYLFSLNDFLFNLNGQHQAKYYFKLLQDLDEEFKQLFFSKRRISQIGKINCNYICNMYNELTSQYGEYINTNKPIYKSIDDILKFLCDEVEKYDDNYYEYGREPDVYRDYIDYSQIVPHYQDYADHPDFEDFMEFSAEGMFILERIKEFINKFKEKLGNELLSYSKDFNFGNEKKFYIPILRGMRPLDVDDQHKNFYGDRTKWDYFRSTGSLTDKMQIFTGLELYQSIKEKLLGEPEERQLVKEFEDFLSINFFENKPVTLIPKEKSPKVVHIKIGNEKQLPIYELGDGLQNLIICTFNIFTEKERCLFFIEEPDMFMHPSLQRSFLEVLSKFDQHQYFITSHSNHFLDMTIDFANISVFHFSKHEVTQPQFHIRPSSPRDRQILLDLGVRNSSVFITNATIWVEGITDRLYLKAYMKKYIDELEHSDPDKYSELVKLKEDYHYSFVEYQGANLTHWNFNPDDDDTYDMKASYICAQAFLIADGDIGSESKGNRKAIYEEMLGNRFLALQVKEIENLIPAEILRQVVAKQFKKYGGNTDLIKDEDYARLDTPIGTYLDNLLPLSKNSLFAAESGTFTSYYKGTLCDNAVKIMKNLEWDLTDDLRAICKEIFDHIITQNKNS
jgi:AAA15 family ATPase/GTPase